MLLNLLLVLEVIVALFLVVVVLLQRSEGGGLVSGGTGSIMSVRGAGDLLTRTTWILGTDFFVLGLLLTIVAGRERGSSSVVDRLKVNAINPAELSREPPTPPAGTAQPGPAGGAPAPRTDTSELVPPLTRPPPTERCSSTTTTRNRATMTSITSNRFRSMGVYPVAGQVSLGGHTRPK